MIPAESILLTYTNGVMRGENQKGTAQTCGEMKINFLKGKIDGDAQL